MKSGIIRHGGSAVRRHVNTAPTKVIFNSMKGTLHMSILHASLFQRRTTMCAKTRDTTKLSLLISKEDQIFAKPSRSDDLSLFYFLRLQDSIPLVVDHSISSKSLFQYNCADYINLILAGSLQFLLTRFYNSAFYSGLICSGITFFIRFNVPPVLYASVNFVLLY